MSSLGPKGSTREWRKTRAYILDRDRLADGTNVCWRCGVTLTHHDPDLPTHATVDHKVERMKGGTDQLDNLAPCCADCNSKAGAKAKALNASRSW